jgi:light-regulated signal transduction histidine kinase (bacteriophytochrome)
MEARVERLVAGLAGSVQEPLLGDQLYAETSAAIDGTFSTYDATLNTLQQLLDIRIAGFQQRRIISFSIVIPSLLVGLWIVVLLQRYMEARNQDLSRANDEYNRVIQELEVAVGRYESQAQELARSNSDLQQFAYVASHDLQEPLRIVGSYAQLFEQRYKSQVDEKGQKWIFYMVDASKRMQALIEDLLMFSRVGTKAKEPAPVDSLTSVQAALANLRMTIQRNGAEVTHDAMPVVVADQMQLTQLFQNLVGNALKYRSEAPPRIHIGVWRDGTQCRFSVRDNGIGIEPRFHERIFGLFQRLHERGKFEGTGIGLAVCKKIVERHGGTIWVESNQDQGTTFHFTLPLGG